MDRYQSLAYGKYQPKVEADDADEPPRRRSVSPSRKGIRNRDRSRSPRRRRERESDRTPEKRKPHREKERSRSPLERKPRREREPELKRSRTPEKRKPRREAKIDLESLANVEDDMMKMMGFGGFDTTKNKKVEGNGGGMAKVNKPRKFRQYMNRKGGFNRPLDYIA